MGVLDGASLEERVPSPEGGGLYFRSSWLLHTRSVRGGGVNLVVWDEGSEVLPVPVRHVSTTIHSDGVFIVTRAVHHDPCSIPLLGLLLDSTLVLYHHVLSQLQAWQVPRVF